MPRDKKIIYRIANVLLAASLSACGGGDSSSSNPSNNGTVPTPPAPVNVVVNPQASIQVLSNRADLISGGEALVQVDAPNGVDPSTLYISLNGANDVRQAFSMSKDGKFMGLVTGLVVGKNVLTVQGPTTSPSSITIVNHPAGGPIFAGPQLPSWTCQPSAIDAQCNQAPSYSWVYFSSDPSKSGIQQYNPSAPPTDVATTVTDQGITVPFIVRIETGYQDRNQYQIAVLYQPNMPWSATNPQPQFNRKLLVTHGVSCGVSFNASNAPSIVSGSDQDPAYLALKSGYAVMSTAQSNSAVDCNVANQAESLVMGKEHLIDHYGTLRFTIGVGGSGGSLAEQWVQNAYPGIYQGLLATAAFPDAWSVGPQMGEDAFISNYLVSQAAKPLGWSNEQKSIVLGGVNWNPNDGSSAYKGDVSTVLNAFIIGNAFFNMDFKASNPGCAISPQYPLYGPSNPAGVRCSLVDYSINIFGPRSKAIWTPSELAVGHGFASPPIDNVGVQYGLWGLQNKNITSDQFIDLNKNVGGSDIDGNFIPTRMIAEDTALSNAYRSGSINMTNNLGETPIIDCLGNPTPGAQTSNLLLHDTYRTLALRARLDKAFKNHSNDVIWGGPTALTADAACFMTAFKALDQWLSAVESDTASNTLLQKIAAHKPAIAVDGCWDGKGKLTSGKLCGEDAVSIFQTPRMIAGDDISTVVNKCQLKPLSRTDYMPGQFSDQQWTDMQSIFPSGVCDFSKPGVGQTNTIPWMTYQNPDGTVIYGGVAMPPVPPKSGSGWASSTFTPFGMTSGQK